MASAINTAASRARRWTDDTWTNGWGAVDERGDRLADAIGRERRRRLAGGAGLPSGTRDLRIGRLAAFFALRRATGNLLAAHGEVPMMTDAEVRAALVDLMEIKRALRRNEMTVVWERLRALELKLGRGLRSNINGGR